MKPPSHNNITRKSLGEPLQFPFAGRSASNRFLKAALTERMACWPPSYKLETRGTPSQDSINLYKRWGEGQAGVIVTGNIMIDADHIEAPGNLIIEPGASFTDDRFHAYEKMAASAKACGSLVLGQVNHPGRQCQGQESPISASAIPLKSNEFGRTYATPHAATSAEIDMVVNGFVYAASYLEAAGYDGIQLHAAHGYLLAQFLSRSTNTRVDDFGGSLENRARLIINIAREIRRRCRPDFVLGIKLNSVEFQEYGFQANEAARLCQILEQEKFDFVELSGGTYEKFAWNHRGESTRQREAFFIEFAEAIVPSLKQTKTYLTGGFKTVAAMTDGLRVVDGIGLGRTLTQEPLLCKHILENKVTGAKEQILDQRQFTLTSCLSGTQMTQLACGKQPLDGSQQESIDIFMDCLKEWKTAAAVGRVSPGWMKI